MGFLSEILAANRPVVEDDSYLDGLPPIGRTTRPSLKEAIESNRTTGSLLAEYKRVSPGQVEPSLPTRALTDFVRVGERAGVTGFSCLATGPRFLGRPLDVLEIARATPRPVLFKDFVAHERQLEAAARSGASAVLLIARLASERHLPRPISELADSAHRWGLEVLLELHAEAELSESDGVAADVYGVNVRDLDSLRIDRAVAESTLRAARESGLGPLLGMSGVDSPADAQRFWSLGVDGILVGTSVARADRPEDLLRSLRRPRAREEG